MVVITMEACTAMKMNKLQPQAAIWVTLTNRTLSKRTRLRRVCAHQMGSNRAKLICGVSKWDYPLRGVVALPFFDLGANYTGENPSSCAWRVLQFSASILYLIENSMQLRKAGLPSGTSRITCHSLPHTCRARVVCSST